MNRQKLLLIIVVALLFARFVLIPLNETRIDKIDVFESKYSRYIKGENLISQKESLQANVAKVESRLQQYQSFYPTAKSSSKAQLSIQQQMQSLAQEKQIILDQVEWVTTVKGHPEKALLEIGFQGNLKDFMFFTTVIDELGPWISITDLQYRIENQKVNWKQLGQAKGTIILEAFYLIKENS